MQENATHCLEGLRSSKWHAQAHRPYLSASIRACEHALTGMIGSNETCLFCLKMSEAAFLCDLKALTILKKNALHVGSSHRTQHKAWRLCSFLAQNLQQRGCDQTRQLVSERASARSRASLATAIRLLTSSHHTKFKPEHWSRVRPGEVQQTLCKSDHLLRTYGYLPSKHTPISSTQHMLAGTSPVRVP